MEIILLRTSDFSEERLIDLIDLLKTLVPSFKFSHNADPLSLGPGKTINWNDGVNDFFRARERVEFVAECSSIEFYTQKKLEVHTWKSLINASQEFREKHQIDPRVRIFLLSETGNEENWTSTTDQNLRNFYVQTSSWEHFFEDNEINTTYTIAHEIISWVLKSLFFNNTNEMIKYIHFNTKGCIMDFCSDKRDVQIKMRTADMCKLCLPLIEKKSIPRSSIIEIFEGFEKIRKYLNFITRFEYLRTPQKMIIKNRTYKILIPDILEDYEIILRPKEKALYLFFLNHPEGIKMSHVYEYKPEILRFYQNVSNRDDPHKQIEVVKNMLDGGLQVELANIRKIFKKLLGEKLAFHYSIEGERGEYYGISLDRELVEYDKDNGLQL